MQDASAIQLPLTNPAKRTLGGMLIPTIILAAHCLLKLVGMALAREDMNSGEVGTGRKF